MIPRGTAAPEYIARGTNCSGVNGPGHHLLRGAIYFVTGPGVCSPSKFCILEVATQIVEPIAVGLESGVVLTHDSTSAYVRAVQVFTGVTVICVPPGIVCLRTHFPSDICSPKQISLAYLATSASVIYVSQG